MADALRDRNDWADYLKRIQRRPGWSVARLARESGIHRATIFEWMKGGSESVTIGSVVAVAAAVGDDPRVALGAAAGLVGCEADPEIDEILNSGLNDRLQEELIGHLMEQRARDEERRRDTLRRMIQIAGGKTA